MAYKLFDFHCTNCDHTFEELVEPDEQVACPNCGGLDSAEKLIATPNLNTMNLLPRNEYVAKMKKRSADHTARTVAKEGVNGQRVIDVRKMK